MNNKSIHGPRAAARMSPGPWPTVTAGGHAATASVLTVPAADGDPMLPRIQRLWASTLGTGEINPDDDFFELREIRSLY